MLAYELADTGDGLLGFREDGCEMMPDVGHVLPDLQLHRHTGRFGAFGQGIGIVEQGLNGSNLNQERREATQISIDRRSEGGLRRLAGGRGGRYHIRAMGESVMDSSDAVRSAAPLRHAKTFRLEGGIELERGGTLEEVVVAYETWGRLSAAADNAVLVCHALSGDSHAARHDENDDAGWWDIVVGPGRPIDTQRYYVVCANVLGGCRGTTGPNSINPRTLRPYGGDFPLITVGDMVRVQRRLLDHLGIDRPLAVVGGSLGGHQALGWATLYPRSARGIAAIATSARLTSQALAFDVVARNAIQRDPNFREGQYYDAEKGPDVGLAIARMLGHITYLSREAMQRKFASEVVPPREFTSEFERKFAVGSYLAYQGKKFVERFDANSYVTLSMAMDLFNLAETPESLRRALAASTARWLVVSFSSDWLFPTEQSREIVDALVAEGKPVSFCAVRSSCGHDAFLLPDNVGVYGELIRGFLANLRGEQPDREAADDLAADDPTSIYHARRLDYDLIMELIEPGSSVLDLGCGAGGLLARLKQWGAGRLVGIELDESEIIACVRRGLDVIHADLNEGLSSFQAGQFDVVVLSQTLQAVADVRKLVDEMLRVGRRCIVSFPNVAFREHRRRLAELGRSPQVATGGDGKWYSTPNIRSLSIEDFREFCADQAIRIHRELFLDTRAERQVGRNCGADQDPNRDADLAIFVISR